MPVSPLAPERWPDGVPVAEGKVPPNVSPSLENAAVSAGLGEIGLCGVFLTPQFGPRQSLAMLITDAPLEPGPAHAGTICDGASCAACAAACPLGAIDVKTATVSRRACRLCPNGVFADETSKQAVPNFLTAACVRACIAHLEEAGKLTKRYNSPFRKRKPWARAWSGGGRMLTSKMVKELAVEAGFDLAGVANIERFDNAPPEMHPCTIFPETKSVVVMATRILRGSYRGVAEGTEWSTYWIFGYGTGSTASSTRRRARCTATSVFRVGGGPGAGQRHASRDGPAAGARRSR